MAEQSYALGVGDIYIMVADEIPSTDTAIEATANKIGSTSGGCTLKYNYDTYTVENDKFAKIDTLKQGETVSFAGNILSFGLETLAKLTANSTVDTTVANTTTLKLGSSSTSIQKVVIRYVHTFKDGTKLKVTLIGNSTAGFELAFSKDKETVVPFEISALSQTDGTLCQIDMIAPVV